MTRIEMTSTEIQRDWSRVQSHLDNGDQVVVVRYSRRIALIAAYPEGEPVLTTLGELADDLGTTIYALMEFAPDDITRDMTGGTEVPVDVEAMIREAWNAPAVQDRPAGREGGVWTMERDAEGNITGAQKRY